MRIKLLSDYMFLIFLVVRSKHEVYFKFLELSFPACLEVILSFEVLLAPSDFETKSFLIENRRHPQFQIPNTSPVSHLEYVKYST